MVQIFEEPESRSSQFGSLIGQGLGQGIGSAISNMLEQKKRQREIQGLAPIFEQLGVPKEGLSELILSGLDPALLSSLAGQLGQQQAKFQSDQAKIQEKRRETEAPLRKGLSTIKRQRELLKTGHLGPKAGGLAQKPKLLSAATKKGQRIRSEYEQLGKSLISLASNIPIRNQAEFKVLADKLYDPTLNEAEIEGILNAMESVISSSLREETGEQPEQVSQPREFQSGQTLDRLPPASETPNLVIRKGKKRFMSDGKSWKEIK